MSGTFTRRWSLGRAARLTVRFHWAASAEVKWWFPMAADWPKMSQFRGNVLRSVQEPAAQLKYIIVSRIFCENYGLWLKIYICLYSWNQSSATIEPYCLETLLSKSSILKVSYTFIFGRTLVGASFLLCDARKWNTRIWNSTKFPKNLGYRPFSQIKLIVLRCTIHLNPNKSK